MSYYSEHKLSIESESYKYITSLAPQEFMYMQIFDYITLNTDRNRDNFGLKQEYSFITGLYPLYDHDSCFKGKSTSALYFVTGVSFDETLTYLKTLPYYPDFTEFYNTCLSEEFKNVFTKFKSLIEYEGFVMRVRNLI